MPRRKRRGSSLGNARHERYFGGIIFVPVGPMPVI